MNRDNYRWHVVGMLWTISFFNYADRQAIFSVFPLLEKSLHLDSVQLGLLGSSFALVYGTCSQFAGLIVDRVRRRTAILGGLEVWSLICMATGLSAVSARWWRCGRPKVWARRFTIRRRCR
jgi:sugar phosphate permease